MIKAILFDYGGTIDTNGKHWGEVLWNSYQKFNLNVPRSLFNQAYAFGEKSLAIYPVVRPEHHFLDVLQLKIEQQFSFLKNLNFTIDDNYIHSISHDCFEIAKKNIRNAKPVLIHLKQTYRLVIVSNFYGNLHTVLKEFELLHLFETIIESAIVGIRKPDPSIYKLGVEYLGLHPKECLIVGDSYTKDIIPAKQIGCKAIWLKGKEWQADNRKEPVDNWNAEGIIKDFKDLPQQIELI